MKNRIAELRRKYNMNQRELGEKLSVGQTTVNSCLTDTKLFTQFALVHVVFTSKLCYAIFHL